MHLAGAAPRKLRPPTSLPMKQPTFSHSALADHGLVPSPSVEVAGGTEPTRPLLGAGLSVEARREGCRAAPISRGACTEASSSIGLTRAYSSRHHACSSCFLAAWPDLMREMIGREIEQRAGVPGATPESKGAKGYSARAGGARW